MKQMPFACYRGRVHLVDNRFVFVCPGRVGTRENRQCPATRHMGTLDFVRDLIRFGPFVCVSYLVVLLCGCGSHDYPQGSRSTNTVLVTPILQERREAENRRARDVRTNSLPLFQFEVFCATVPEGELGRLGLQSLFQQEAQTLPAALR